MAKMQDICKQEITLNQDERTIIFFEMLKAKEKAKEGSAELETIKSIIKKLS